MFIISHKNIFVNSCDLTIIWLYKSLPGLNDVIPGADSSTHQDTHEELLAKIIMWLLGQEKISNKQIKDHFEMG